MKIVAIKEMSTGNESVGNMWLETKIFEPTDTLDKVIEFGKKSVYSTPDDKLVRRLMLTIAEETQQ